MLGGTKYFFDSYALIALWEDATNYRKFGLSEGSTALTNLMEVQYYLHRNGKKEFEIREAISDLLPICIEFSEEDCFEAVKFRFKNKDKNMSYTDCLGYALAKRRGTTFVTGDLAFEGLPNVEFVRI